MEFLIIVLIIIVAIFIKSQNDKTETVNKLQQEAIKQKEEEQKKERFEKFCELHPEIRSLSDTVKRETNELVRCSLPLLSVNIQPTPPTYTRGLYKGSLGDNISTLSNAQKKAEYESAMATYNENETKKIQARIEGKRIAKRLYDSNEKLIAALIKIQGSDEFLADAKKTRDFAASKI